MITRIVNGSCIFFVLLSFVSESAEIQKPLDEIYWHFDGNRFRCEISTDLKFDGGVKIISKSSSPLELIFYTHQRPYFIDEASLYLNITPWQEASELRLVVHGHSTDKQGLHFAGNQPLKTLLSEMELGAWATISASYEQHQSVMQWQLPSVNFQPAYQEMKVCMDNLLPLDYEQAKENEFHFSVGQFALSKQQQQYIDDIVAYMDYDQSVTRVLVDGHTDNQGERLQNLTLSRQRAEAVQQAFVNAGISKSRIHVRNHGQRYPKNNNATAAERRDNRRVQVRLQRGGGA